MRGCKGRGFPPLSLLESPPGRLRPEAFLRESVVIPRLYFLRYNSQKLFRNSLSTLDSVFFQQISQKKCRLCPEAETAEACFWDEAFNFREYHRITGKITSQFCHLEKFQLLGSKLSFTRVKVSLRTTE